MQLYPRSECLGYMAMQLSYSAALVSSNSLAAPAEEKFSSHVTGAGSWYVAETCGPSRTY